MVLSSAAEAEYGGLFINAKEEVPILTTLQELGQNQPKTGTPLKTDNSTAHVIVHNNVRQNKLRCFDTGFHCIRNRSEQSKFDVYWKPGPNNKEAYATKHPPLPYTDKCAQRTYAYHLNQHPHCEGVLILGSQRPLNRRYLGFHLPLNHR